MKSFSQMTDAEILAWAKNLISVARANPAEFGLTAQILDDLEDVVNGLETKMQLRFAADETAAAAVKAQQMSRQTLEPSCVYVKGTIKINPAIPEDRKVQAGVEPDKPASHTPPAAPTNLVVNGYENGTNVLKWNRAGNRSGTQYLIESRVGTETEFRFLAITTETTFTHEGATPGQQCAYRIKAQRAGEQSTYSNVAIVYMT